MKSARSFGLTAIALAGAAYWAWPFLAAAQTPPVAAPVAPAAAAPGLMITIQQVMRIGGGTMYVIAGMSVLTVAFIAYFAYVIRVQEVAPRALQREIADRLNEGSLDAAWRACMNHPCPYSAIVMAAVDHVKQVPELSLPMLKDVMEGEGARQSELIQGQTQYLLDIAVISPMIGLFGTVVGMLQAFSSVSLDVAGARPLLLVAGVSKALYATAFGLLVGIPSMAFYGYYRRKAARVVASLEVACINLLTSFAVFKTK